MTIKTHKEIKQVADRYRHEWSTEAIPRDLREYEPVPAEDRWGWSHFLDSLKSRQIPLSVIGSVLAGGDVYPAEGDNRYRFLWTCPSTLRTYSLIVEMRPESPHYMITLYRVNRI